MWTKVVQNVTTFALLLVTPLAAQDPFSDPRPAPEVAAGEDREQDLFGDPTSAPEVATGSDTSAPSAGPAVSRQDNVAPSSEDDLFSAPNAHEDRPGTPIVESTEEDPLRLSRVQSETHQGNGMNIKVFTLQNTRAVEVLNILQLLFPDEKRFAADTRTNTIVAAGTPEHLATVAALLMRLDSTESASGANAASNSFLRPNTGDPWQVKVFDSEGIAALRQEYDSAERNAQRIADEIRQPKNDSVSVNETSALREKLHSAVQQAFDARQKLQSAEAQSLREKLQAIEERIRQRQELRDRIIDRRVEDLMADVNLNWNAGPSDGQEDSTWPSYIRSVGPEDRPL